ncbi:uncharacterized protein [Leptinotarsa decemlineata]|uniref:uncharacterized protein n=1 Tax=Leptinotarsa decemlineata TaxID=7539 RepID=UPI000C252AE4|nr:uncharacterized protein LOC111517443 [Leptinotarsa decemlineata]
MKVLASLLVAIAIFNGFDCQVYYHPVQVLIPTINGTLATNHSIHNNTSYGRPPSSFINNGYNNNYPAYNGSARYNSSVYNGTQDGHLFIGTIQTFDRLLFNQEYFKPRRWYSSRDKTVEYPKDLPAGYSRHETISAIRIYNKFYDGNSARATILSGGIGRQYVKINLHSTWGNGFRYLVQIYGR